MNSYHDCMQLAWHYLLKGKSSSIGIDLYEIEFAQVGPLKFQKPKKFLKNGHFL